MVYFFGSPGAAVIAGICSLVATLLAVFQVGSNVVLVDGCARSSSMYISCDGVFV